MCTLTVALNFAFTEKEQMTETEADVGVTVTEAKWGVRRQPRPLISSLVSIDVKRIMLKFKGEKKKCKRESAFERMKYSSI